MQPTAIRKFRTMTIIPMAFLAVAGTSVFLFSYKKWFVPWRKRSKFAASELFAEEYFQKHKKPEKSLE